MDGSTFHVQYLWLLINTNISFSQIGFPQVYRITEADQNERVDEEHIACLRKQLSEPPARDGRTLNILCFHGKKDINSLNDSIYPKEACEAGYLIFNIQHSD